MTQKEAKLFLDNMLLVLEDVKKEYNQKKTEYMEKSLQYEEMRKVYSIRERTIEDMIYVIKRKQSEINKLLEKESE